MSIIISSILSFFSVFFTKIADFIRVETIAGHSLKGIQSVYTNYHLEDLTQIIEWQKELYAEMKKAALD